MKRFALAFAVAALLTSSLWAQSYSFQTVNYPGDTFTQLLSVNNNGEIAGYHGATINKGFTLVLPDTFTNENFPGSAQTQVTGIDNKGVTVGFYINSAGTTLGFVDQNNKFTTVSVPGTTFNQLLGKNDLLQAVGYYQDSANNDHGYIYYGNPGGTFALFELPKAVSVQATDINNSQWVSGFYVDKNKVTHGFLLEGGTLLTLNFPGSTFTQALGLNNKDQVVGTYNDASNLTHGFVYNVSTSAWTSIDDPNGIGTTIVNGINDNGELVGFYVDASNNTDGMVATPAP